jgi:poly(3-hydroxybutyrate) depolymerase
MRKLFLTTWFVGLSAQLVACSSESGGGDAAATGGSSAPATGGSTVSSSTAASRGGNTNTGGSSIASTTLATSGGSTAVSRGGNTGTVSSSTAIHGGGSTSVGGASSGGNASVGGSSTSRASGGASAMTGGSSAVGTGGASNASAGSGAGGRGGASSSSAVAGKSAGGSSTGTVPLNNDPVPSKGCGKTDGLKTLTSGGSSIANGLPTSTRLKITSGGTAREYIIDVPADYDPTKPYRLIFSWHQAYGSDTGNAVGQYPANNGPNFDAKNYAYFGLRREATSANQPSIFVAPGGIGDLPWDYKRDVALFDELLALVSDSLCIDQSRVFTTGFSYGAMMSYALSITRQTKLRAAVTMAAADYNLPGEPTDSNAAPIAYLGFTGVSDERCPWVNPQNANQGGKACVLTHAKDNNCTIPGTIQTTTAGSKKYLCYDFEGCKAGYPVKVCTFDGNHTPSSIDDGSSNGDDGLKSFIPTMSWKFIAQF